MKKNPAEGSKGKKAYSKPRISHRGSLKNISERVTGDIIGFPPLEEPRRKRGK